MTRLVDIRNAISADARRIRRLAVESGIDAWSEKDYRDEAGREDSLFHLASIAGEPVGFALGRLVPGSGEGHDLDLYNIAVSENHRRHGIGSVLLQQIRCAAAIHKVMNIWLEVRRSNAAAISFYRKNGFVEVAERVGFYRDPVENAIVMKCKCQGPPVDFGGINNA